MVCSRAISRTGKSRVVQELVGQSPVPARVVAGGLGSMHEAYGVASRLVGVDLPEPVPADAPERLLAGLDELAARGPQLLVVDDVHRVDAATLALLERVAGSARDLRLALVLTREPTPERAFLSRILSDATTVSSWSSPRSTPSTWTAWCVSTSDAGPGHGCAAS